MFPYTTDWRGQRDGATMVETYARAGSKLNRDTVIAEKACTVALLHTNCGEETFERYLTLNKGDVLIVVRQTMVSDGRFPAQGDTGSSAWHSTTF